MAAHLRSSCAASGRACRPPAAAARLCTPSSTVAVAPRRAPVTWAPAPGPQQHAAPAPARRVAAASGNADAATAVQAGLRELNQAEFWGFLEASADKLTVVDFYTDWCGPCKLIAPELAKLHTELEPQGVQIVKFNCNSTNKELGKELGIKVAPTFHLYRGREKVGEMTGAKVDSLRALIDNNRN